MTWLERFFQELNRNLSAECVERIVLIRNFEGLPSNKPGNDIDIIVRQEALGHWRKALVKTAKNLGLALSNLYRAAYVEKYAFVENDTPSGFRLELDLNFLLNWRGVEFFAVDELLKDTDLYAYPIYTARSSGSRAFITFCHSFLYGGFINPKYLSSYRHALEVSGGDFAKYMEMVFSLPDAKFLIRCVETGCCEIPRWKANKIRVAAILKAFKGNPSAFLPAFFSSLMPHPTRGLIYRPPCGGGLVE